MTRKSSAGAVSEPASGRMAHLVAALRTAGADNGHRPVIKRSASLDAMLPVGHRARLIWDYVVGGAGGDAAGMAHFDAEASGASPEVLLAIWLYANGNGIGSAQEVAERCRSHAGFRWLASGSSVDARRLTEFRMQAPMAVDELLTESLAGLRLAGLFGGGEVSAGRDESDLLRCLEDARRRVRDLRQKLDDPIGEETARRIAALAVRLNARQAKATAAIAGLRRLVDAQAALQRREDLANRRAEREKAGPPLLIKPRPVLGVEPILPWTVVGEEIQRFRRALGAAVAAILVLVTILVLVKPPPVERAEAEKISPRLARLVLEKKEPLKAERVKIEEATPKERRGQDLRAAIDTRQEPARAETRRETFGGKPNGQQVAEARERAGRTGLVAMRDQLLALRALSSADAMRHDQISVGGDGTTPRGERDLIGSVATAGSGGVSGRSIAYSGGGSLAGYKTTQVNAPRGGPSLAEINKEKSGKRSPEDIKLGFDANKSALYAIYRRVLRENPQLEGRVVLKLTIDAAGQVTACSIVSSALKDAALEEKLLARVSLINFGARAGVEAWTGNYHIDFVPAS